MVLPDPIQPARSRSKPIVWAVGISDLIIFGAFLYVFDDAGLLGEDWSWILVVGLAVVMLASFFTVRYVLEKAAKTNQADTDL